MDRLWAPWRLEYIERGETGGRCPFCEPEESLIVQRGALALTVLNRFPYAPGHLLVSPLRHVAELEELSDAEALELHRQSVECMRRLREAYAPHGFNLGWNLGSVAGGSITAHLHLHVVPRWNGDTNFMPVLADVKVLPEALVETARRLAMNVEP
jgi:ATP adenylyltransferase